MKIRPRTNWRRTGVALLAGLALGGCAVGPNFKTPAPPHLDAYDPSAQPRQLAADGSTQTLEPGQATDPKWWRLFGSPALNDVVAAGLKSSPTLASARAALDQSQDQARAGAGVFFPSLTGEAAATREHTNPVQFGEAGKGSTFSLYTLSGAISYPLDLFGGERRQVEALNAEADYQRNAVGAAYLTLTGSIVETAIARAAYADEVAALADVVGLDQAEREALNAQYGGGTGALAAVLAAEQQLDADRQSLAVARQRLAASTTLLQTLMGREPAEASPAPPSLDDLMVPDAAPDSLPSQLVRQRPDILEAEATLHQASAQVGVATAALFPSISLTGDYGAASLSLASLASPAGRFWSIGPTIDVPIFRGGALIYGRKAAQAGYVKAASDYRQIVLAALEQVADQIRALDTDAEVADAARGGSDAADLNRKLADANRQAGLIADLDAMAANATAERARLVLISARAQRLQDVAALYLASGGGWDAGSGDVVAAAAAK